MKPVTERKLHSPPRPRTPNSAGHYEMDQATFDAIPFANTTLNPLKMFKCAQIEPSLADILETLNQDIFVNVWGCDWEMLYGLKPQPETPYDYAARVLLVDGRFDILERMLSARIVFFPSLMNFAFEPKNAIDGYVFWPYKNKRRLMTNDESKMRIDWVVERSF